MHIYRGTCFRTQASSEHMARSQECCSSSQPEAHPQQPGAVLRPARAPLVARAPFKRQAQAEIARCAARHGCTRVLAARRRVRLASLRRGRARPRRRPAAPHCRAAPLPRWAAARERGRAGRRRCLSWLRRSSLGRRHSSGLLCERQGSPVRSRRSAELRRRRSGRRSGSARLRKQRLVLLQARRQRSQRARCGAAQRAESARLGAGADGRAGGRAAAPAARQLARRLQNTLTRGECMAVAPGKQEGRFYVGGVTGTSHVCDRAVPGVRRTSRRVCGARKQVGSPCKTCKERMPVDRMSEALHVRRGSGSACLKRCRCDCPSVAALSSQPST
jgi:hypothetical protein